MTLTPILARLAPLGAAAVLALTLHPAAAQQRPAQPPAAQTDPAEATPEIEPKQVQLTPALVEKFIVSWPEFEALRTRLDKRFGKQSGGEEEADPLFALGAYLEQKDARADINKLLTKHGFATFADWANVAHSVMLAFGAADPEQGPMDMEAEKKRVAEEIQNDTSLTPADKEQALKDLEEQFAALDDFQPLPGNVEAVQPHFERLRKLFEQ